MNAATLRACPHGVTHAADRLEADECLQCEELRALRALAKEVQRLEDELGTLTPKLSEALDALHSIERRQRGRDTLPDGLLEEERAFR